MNTEQAIDQGLLVEEVIDVDTHVENLHCPHCKAAVWVTPDQVLHDGKPCQQYIAIGAEEFIGDARKYTGSLN